VREDRKHPRYPCSLPCTLITDNGEFEASVINVSVGGLYLESEVLMDEGARFRVQIEGLRPEPLVVPVELVHFRYLSPDSDKLRSGYGVRVEKVDAAFLDFIAELAEATEQARQE